MTAILQQNRVKGLTIVANVALEVPLETKPDANCITTKTQKKILIQSATAVANWIATKFEHCYKGSALLQFQIATKVWYFYKGLALPQISSLQQRFSIATEFQHCYKGSGWLQSFSIATMVQHCYRVSALQQWFSIATECQHCNKGSALLQCFSTATKVQTARRLNSGLGRARKGM